MEVTPVGKADGAVELQFGDCVFTGNGPDGECQVGFERKRLSDLVSSMKDRRLSGHQLRGLWKAVDFVYLVCEGVWREGGSGEIEEWGWVPREKKQGWRPFYSSGNGGSGEGGRRAVSYEQLDHYLCTLELKGGVVVKRTRDALETARYYVSRWRWFNQKLWVEHTSADQVYTGGLVKKGHGGGWAEPHGHSLEFAAGKRAPLRQADPTTLWRMAAQLPGVDRRAEAVAAHFGTVRAMALAEAGEWEALDGFGKKTAAAVVRAITERGA